MLREDLHREFEVDLLVHSGKVRAVQFSTCPKICVATFFREFGVDANCYITS